MRLNGFNLIAPYYDQLAQLVFGQSIRTAQTFYLKQIPDHAKVLVIGGGTGWWLTELQRVNPSCRIWFIEASSAMLQRARKNGSSQVVFIHGSETDIPAVQFDVVITYFFLDMFTNVEMKEMLPSINSFLKEDGMWLVSDFVNRKWWHRILLFVMYFFFRVIGAIKTKRLYGWQETLEKINLTRKSRAFFFRDFITSCLFIKDKII